MIVEMTYVWYKGSYGILAVYSQCPREKLLKHIDLEEYVVTMACKFFDL